MWAWATLDDTTPLAALIRTLNTRMSLLERELRAPGLIASIPDGTTTPVVGPATVLQTANTAPVSVTTFLRGTPAKVLVLVAGDDNTTLVEGATLRLNGGVNVLLSTGDTKLFVTTDGLSWSEVPLTNP